MSEVLTKWGGELLAAVVLGVAGFLYRMAYRVEVLERLFKDKKATLEGVVTTSASHEKRLAVIESVIADLKELTPALQKIASLTGKVETLLETSLHRLDRLEHEYFRETT
jgi:hypothetical protein